MTRTYAITVRGKSGAEYSFNFNGQPEHLEGWLQEGFEIGPAGLCAGLKSEQTGRQFRCAACSAMQPAGEWMVWVPDQVRRGDPAWSVTEACANSRWSGHFSGWCVACAPKQSSRTPLHKPWWRRLIRKALV